MFENLNEFHSCPICNSERIICIGKKKTTNKHSNLVVSIIKCNECFHWHTNPTPDQNLLSKLYQEESSYVIEMKLWTDNTKKRNLQQNLAPNKNWIVKELENYKIGNYLEVGSGSGELLKKMKSLGWNVYGIDSGNYATSDYVFKNENKLPVDIKFDVIVFKDVMEHCSDPNDTLGLYKKYLKKNSILFMCVPWSESKAANKRNIYWEMVKPFGHLHYFSMKSSEILLKKNSFKIEKKFTRNFYRNYFFSLFANFASLLYLCFKPSKWWLINQRIEKIITLTLLFPGDKKGDQLYIKAIKV